MEKKFSFSDSSSSFIVYLCDTQPKGFFSSLLFVILSTFPEIIALFVIRKLRSSRLDLWFWLCSSMVPWNFITLKILNKLKIIIPWKEFQVTHFVRWMDSLTERVLFLLCLVFFWLVGSSLNNILFCFFLKMEKWCFWFELSFRKRTKVCCI